jgi:hypothetical protein
MGNLIPTGFPWMDRPAQHGEGVQEERPHEVRLQTPGFRLFHALFHRKQPLQPHRFLG